MTTGSSASQGLSASGRGSDNGADSFARLAVGHTDSVEKTIRREDVDAFASLSGDHNALHVDDQFAARTEFEQRVVHGFLHASLLSALVGMKIPGPGALYLSQTMDFTGPVFIGDTVKATGTVTSIDRETRVIGIKTQITNQRGQTVLIGEAKVKVLRLVPTAPTGQQRKVSTMSDLLSGRVALVTGGSRGIGRSIAAMLATHGAKVWVNYNRSEDAARTLASEIAAEGGACSLVKADVAQADDVAAMLECVKREGDLHILVNNAGPKIHSAGFEDLTWPDMQSAFEQIVGSVFRVTQAALPSLQKTRGKIVNVLTSAIVGRTAYNWLPYVTAKSALLGLSKNLAQELGPSGIQVNMVSPSLTDTDLVANIPERVRQGMVSRTPLRRLARVDDVAGAVLFLASPYSDFVTGENLLVTGGEVMV
jgi:3-oxoacyl-[acyl-carrier protein] reductase